MLDELQKYNNLKEAREKDRREKARNTLKKYSAGKNKDLTKNTIQDAKNLVKSATPTGFFSLLFQMNPISDWMYGLALFAAILKDLLDLMEATGVLYILVIVATFCCSVFIAMMMLLGSFSTGHGRALQKTIIRNWLVLLGGTTTELVFGINLMPIETLTVLIIYALMLAERKQAKEQAKKEQKLEPSQAYV